MWTCPQAEVCSAWVWRGKQEALAFTLHHVAQYRGDFLSWQHYKSPFIGEFCQLIELLQNIIIIWISLRKAFEMRFIVLIFFVLMAKVGHSHSSPTLVATAGCDMPFNLTQINFDRKQFKAIHQCTSLIANKDYDDEKINFNSSCNSRIVSCNNGANLLATSFSVTRPISPNC